MFNGDNYDVYKITLKPPFMNIVYSDCPGELYEKSTPFSSFPNKKYDKLF
jgi:hypothetical protein